MKTKRERKFININIKEKGSNELIFKKSITYEKVAAFFGIGHDWARKVVTDGEYKGYDIVRDRNPKYNRGDKNKGYTKNENTQKASRMTSRKPKMMVIIIYDQD